jgi:DNA-binding transcriptional MerR regulator
MPRSLDPYRYAIGDLERETGINPRTVRYYISEGLLPPAHGRGPTATYDLGHLLRLRAIRQLQGNYLPLAEIKEQLGRLDDDQIAAMLNIQSSPLEDRWRRVLLHADIEIHVRERGDVRRDSDFDKAVDRIIDVARAVVADLETPR